MDMTTFRRQRSAHFTSSRKTYGCRAWMAGARPRWEGSARVLVLNGRGFQAEAEMLPPWSPVGQRNSVRNKFWMGKQQISAALENIGISFYFRIKL